MNTEEHDLLTKIAVGMELTHIGINDIKKDIENLQSEFKKTNEDVIENRINHKHLIEKVEMNYKKQKEEIDGAFIKISSCGIDKSKQFQSEKDNMDKHITNSIKIAIASLQIKFYVAILVAVGAVVTSIIKDLLK